MPMAVLMRVVVIVIVIVVAVAMVVIAVAVIEAGIIRSSGDLVGFEQSHAEQQRQGHVAFHGAHDPCIVLHGPELLLHRLKTFFADEIAFVQQQDVAVNHLCPADFRVKQSLIEILCIHQRDDRVEAGLIAQFTAEEGHRHR